jgi:tRNA A-37 threonylcarbamoyl transferase component Bud32
VSPATISCPSCAEPLPEKAKFCPSCGFATPAGVFTATSEVASAAKAAPAEEGTEHRDRLQRALGDGLKIRRLLGRGGFAEVWSAFDVRLKREVAVKTLRYDLVISDMLLQRFQREAEAVAKLRHPNIIPIYEVGEGEGIAYFVMPMIEGESLGEALDREGAFSIEEACRILREAAEALAAAHRAGIVHRDIKPDNIMLEGPERRPIVMDFGIAKATTGGDAKLTGTGMAMGTPHYMSPEQASGEKNLDARSDQYALALVGYRMLVGRLPFEAETMPSLIMKQITEVPKPIIELRSDVPRDLSIALAKALSKDPAARFASMEEFAAAIPRFGSGGGAGTTGRPRPTATELARFPGAIMPSWKSPAALLGVLALVAAVVLSMLSRPRGPIAAAAKRGDALFIGRAFLTKRGASGSYDEQMTFGHDDTAYVWLQRAFGTQGADDRVANDRSVFRWSLRWERSPSKDARETWTAGVAPSGQIATFAQAIPDTLAGATITADSARHLAEAFLGDVGVDVKPLTRVMDSTVTRAKRTDHVFAWQGPTRIVSPAGDTATQRLRVNVAGDRIRDYRSSIDVPKAFTRSLKSGTWHDVGVLAVVIAWTVLLIAAIVLAVQRQRTDTLQWKLGVRLGVVAVVFSAIAFVQENVGGLNASSAVGLAIGLIFVGLLALCGMLFGAVTAESLANEVNPRALVGFESVARLRLGAPEWPAALLRGVALGGLLVAVAGAISFVARTVFWRGDHMPEGINAHVPWLFPVGKIGLALMSTIIVFFAVHFLLRFIKRPWLAIGLPALAVGLMGMEPAMRPWVFSIGSALGFGIMCWTVWRYGFLTAAIAFWVSEVLSVAIELSAIGNDRYLMAGTVAIVMLVALPALAFLSRARLAARA